MQDALDAGIPPVADLSEAEARLWEAFGRGEQVDLRVGDPDSDDPGSGSGWGEARQVRAAVVAALLLGAVQPTAGYVPGVSLRGALITGDLDMRGGVVSCAAVLEGMPVRGHVAARRGENLHRQTSQAQRSSCWTRTPPLSVEISSLTGAGLE